MLSLCTTDTPPELPDHHADRIRGEVTQSKDAEYKSEVSIPMSFFQEMADTKESRYVNY